MSNLPALTSIIKSRADIEAFAIAAVKSRFYAGIGTPEQAMTQIMAGIEIGVPPMTALSNIHIIKGKPVLSGALIAAKIKQSDKYDYTKISGDDKQATVAILSKRPDTNNPSVITTKEIGRETFTIEDAERAGVAKGDNWKKYPQAMLFWRALTQAARFHCPDVFMGAVYMPEEMGQPMDEDGCIIEGEIVQPEPFKTEVQMPQRSSDKITDKQRAELFVAVKEKNIVTDDLKYHLHKEYGIESSSDIKAEDFQKIMEWVKNA